MVRDDYQASILSEDLTNRIKLDTAVFNQSIRPLVKEGKILEYGCGNGIILKLLNKNFQSSTIVGVDLSEYLLNEVEERGLNNVITVKSNIIDDIFTDKCFDTVIFHKSLHELEETEGRSGTIKAIKNAYKVVKDNGVVIIRENLKPTNNKRKIRLKSSFAKSKFQQFINDFKPTKPEVFSYENDIAEVSEHIALEFITKYDERDWKSEMNEPHFFFNKLEWEGLLQEIGFNKVIISTDTINQINLNEKSKDFELLFDLPIYRSTISAYK